MTIPTPSPYIASLELIQVITYNAFSSVNFGSIGSYPFPGLGSDDKHPFSEVESGNENPFSELGSGSNNPGFDGSYGYANGQNYGNGGSSLNEEVPPQDVEVKRQAKDHKIIVNLLASKVDHPVANVGFKENKVNHVARKLDH